jgi:hypothetical protein
MAVLEFYRDQKRPLAESEKLPDFKIPFEGDAAPVLIADDAADPVKAILSKMLEDSGNGEMERQLADMLRGIQRETGVEYQALAGSGAYMRTIRCRTQTGKLAALKVSKKSRPADRMHNDPALREAANKMAWQRRTQCNPVQSLIPAPLYLMADGTSCLGTSGPDADGNVFSFLFEEWIEGVTFSDLVAGHKKLWQENGTFPDNLNLRLEMFNPLSHGVFVFAHNSLAIMNINFDNVMCRTTGPLKGTIAFIETGLGHTFTRSLQSVLDTNGQPQPDLLNRRCTSLALCAAEGSGAKAVKRLPKGNLLQLGRKQPGNLIRCITRKEVDVFLVLAWRILRLGLWVPKKRKKSLKQKRLVVSMLVRHHACGFLTENGHSRLSS